MKIHVQDEALDYGMHAAQNMSVYFNFFNGWMESLGCLIHAAPSRWAKYGHTTYCRRCVGEGGFTPATDYSRDLLRKVHMESIHETAD